MLFILLMDWWFISTGLTWYKKRSSILVSIQKFYEILPCILDGFLWQPSLRMVVHNRNHLVFPIPIKTSNNRNPPNPKMPKTPWKPGKYHGNLPPLHRCCSTPILVKPQGMTSPTFRLGDRLDTDAFATTSPQVCFEICAAVSTWRRGDGGTCHPMDWYGIRELNGIWWNFMG